MMKVEADPLPDKVIALRLLSRSDGELNWPGGSVRRRASSATGCASLRRRGAARSRREAARRQPEMTRGTLEAANLCAEAELEAQRSIVTGSVGTLRLGIASGPRWSRTRVLLGCLELVSSSAGCKEQGPAPLSALPLAALRLRVSDA
jgi:hypothetical protein